MIDQFLIGLGVVLQPNILMYAFIGVFIGQLIGVLPGIGAITAISLLLPVTFYLDATTSMIMLAGIYYGSQYGGSIASILLNLPGTPSSVVTCLEGYPLAQNHRAGLALFVAAFSSFVGGMVGVAILVLAAIPMTIIALRFGAPEYAMLVILGLLAASLIGTGSQIRSFAMVVLGIALGLVGADATTGYFRFVAMPELADGISLVSLAMGLFGVSEIIRNASYRSPPGPALSIKMRDVIPTRAEARSLGFPILRGSAIGSFFGALPGTGAAIASFMAYAMERRVSRTPNKFGTGHLPGLAAPESANNAAAQTGFIPTLTLGIPGDAVMALIIGALILNGIIPGPRLMVDQPDLFWGVIASFFVGNIILLMINIPLIRFWVLLLRIPYQKLYPVIIVMICVGVYSHRTSVTDVMLTLAFGVLGYLMKNYRFEPAPVLLGFVLGPLLEDNFRRTMLLYSGDFTIFLTRPISAVLVACSTLLILFAIWSSIAVRRKPDRSPT
ncbi:tripartite tricarboxylate transporter permease [Flavimaricola marinus]|uniref:Tripartite tricarboxylate transporter TctA family protein n=1 Tax=Flavimaricola marinus TaxID=1819565 RepID=A0A238LEP0_9RHOB|nr:tripartite tricarboxylate transporter permease [Flavimaricola marinus]SMY07426.1 Tripartite tricarboxylate transporter TctA family protein [Flavimaricola marinus]